MKSTSKSWDPTRIPRVMRALQNAWEGQPDLPLSVLAGILRNRGVGWGTSDDELIEVLTQLEAEHPSLLNPSVSTTALIETTSPARRVTLVTGVVVVRTADTGGEEQMPSAWPFDAARPVGPGRPLVITDTEGFEHRLGVATSIAVFEPSPVPAGLQRIDIGDAQWMVILPDGARTLLGRKLRVWTQQRRAVERDVIAWERVVACEEGHDFVVQPAGGGPELSLGAVERVVQIEP